MFNLIAVLLLLLSFNASAIYDGSANTSPPPGTDVSEYFVGSSIYKMISIPVPGTLEQIYFPAKVDLDGKIKTLNVFFTTIEEFDSSSTHRPMQWRDNISGYPADILIDTLTRVQVSQINNGEFFINSQDRIIITINIDGIIFNLPFMFYDNMVEAAPVMVQPDNHNFTDQLVNNTSLTDEFINAYIHSRIDKTDLWLIFDLISIQPIQ